MREYGQIQSAFWQSADAEAMSDRAKLLVCYLLTGPYTNGLGCFRVTDGNLMDDLGWVSETVSETLSELSHIGFAYRLGKVLFLPNFLRWNAIANPKVAKARIKELETLPTNETKALAARVLLKFCAHLTDDQKTVLQTLSETVSETVLQTLSKQNPTQPYPEPTQSNPIQNQNPRAEEREKPTGRLKPKPKRHPRPDQTFADWLASLNGEMAIPEDDPVFASAEKSGLPDEFVALEWAWFRRKYEPDAKRYRDWRQVFRNAIDGAWGNLWRSSDNGGYVLTTAGQQLQRSLESQGEPA
ncbi:MAG: hypothetical protein ACREPQ_09730 [Rhodanobacter sp.]